MAAEEALAANRLAEAFELFFLDALANPTLSRPVVNLSVIARRIGWLDHALLFCTRAIALAGGELVGLAHFEMGNVQRSLGEFNAAFAHYRKALESIPDWVLAHRGCAETALLKGCSGDAREHLEAMRRLGGVDDAELAFLHARLAALETRHDLAHVWWRCAVRRKPTAVRYWEWLYDNAQPPGWRLVLVELLELKGQDHGMPRDAARAALEALVRKAAWGEVCALAAELHCWVEDDGALYLRAAMALYDAEQFAPLTALLRQCGTDGPMSAALYQLAGVAFARCGRQQEAGQAFSHALRLEPDNPELLANVSHFLLTQDELDGALAAARKAAQLAPLQARCHIVLVRALARQFMAGDTLAAIERGLALPQLSLADRTELHHYHGQALLDLGCHEQALAAFARALDCSPTECGTLSALALASLYSDRVPIATVANWHRAAGAAYAASASCSGTVATAWSDPPQRQRILRIGLVSADFQHHPVGLLLSSWLGHVDQSLFELYAYDSTPREDAVTVGLKAMVRHWRTVHGAGPAELAARILQDRIDILVDLAGHTMNNHLQVFALKPSPLQLSWAGYVFSSGLDEIDGVIQDSFSAPAHTERWYRERILRLPCMTYCYVPPSPCPPVCATPALANGYITFGCFNHTPKLTGHTLSLWARVLQAIPTARLLLKSRPFADQGVRRAFRTRLSALGVTPERIEFEGPSDFTGYLRAYERVDIALDTFPFNGGVTSLQGLWQGVPLLTRAGERHDSRVGGAMMHALSLPSWVADTDEQFVAAAIAHTSDIGALDALRRSMPGRLRSSTLGDGARYARHMQELWSAAWRDYCQEAAGRAQSSKE